jgi:hypothetical protein
LDAMADDHDRRNAVWTPELTAVFGIGHDARYPAREWLCCPRIEDNRGSGIPAVHAKVPV